MKKHGVESKPKSLTDDKLQDRLCDNLNVHQRTYCKQISYNWFEESYSKTVATLSLGEERIVEAMDKAKENKEFHEAAYKETIWKLSLVFFGDNPYGCNNSLGLKQVMSKLTPDP